jgi:mRNA interferase HigB
VISVRIIKPGRIREHARNHPDAAPSLMAWLKIARKARWKNIQEVRQTLPSADGVKAASGGIVTVFNIAGNKFRLIVAIHYDRARLFVLRFLTHADYDREKWKDEL